MMDEAVSNSARALLNAERPAFLLGSVAADAHPQGSKREDTHFYAYDKPMPESPWHVMLRRYPSLQPAHSLAHRAFMAGYVAHLAMDEIWTMHMLGPYFVQGDWATGKFRFLMLHALLITMDERDLDSLEPWQYPALAAAQPDDWLPFIPDAALADWRDFIAAQIRPGGESQTLQVFGARINKTPDELRQVLASPDQMHLLWQNVTPQILADIEAQMYDHAREQMRLYLNL